MYMQPLPAQDNSAPPPAFGDGHAVVLVGGTIYDPSYGKTFSSTTVGPTTYSALSNWETRATNLHALCVYMDTLYNIWSLYSCDILHSNRSNFRDISESAQIAGSVYLWGRPDRNRFIRHQLPCDHNCSSNGSKWGSTAASSGHQMRHSDD